MCFGDDGSEECSSPLKSRYQGLATFVCVECKWLSMDPSNRLGSGPCVETPPQLTRAGGTGYTSTSNGRHDSCSILVPYYLLLPSVQLVDICVTVSLSELFIISFFIAVSLYERHIHSFIFTSVALRER